MIRPWSRIEIPDIVLEWEVVAWHALSGAKMPQAAGVYEIYRAGEEDGPALQIGQTRNLRRRLKKDLLLGKHSTGEKIREAESLGDLIVMYALTKRPACVEEELLRVHQDLHGQGPICAAKGGRDLGD